MPALPPSEIYGRKRALRKRVGPQLGMQIARGLPRHPIPGCSRCALGRCAYQTDGATSGPARLNFNRLVTPSRLLITKFCFWPPLPERGLGRFLRSLTGHQPHSRDFHTDLPILTHCRKGLNTVAEGRRYWNPLHDRRSHSKLYPLFTFPWKKFLPEMQPHHLQWG